MDDERFTGAVCFSMLHHVPSPELQDELFREAARVLRQGAPFVAVDAAWSEGTAAFHEGDTYQPIDPDTLPGRLRSRVQRCSGPAQRVRLGRVGAQNLIPSATPRSDRKSTRLNSSH